MLEAIAKTGMTAGRDVFLALDVASSELWAGRRPLRLQEVRRSRTHSDQMIELYEDWLRQYPIVSIEDGLAEGDWNGWKALTAAIGARVQLVGDDVFVTNPAILKRGIAEGIGNALLVKLNQIGTVTETLDAMHMASAAGYASIISHRSGETEDSTIADLAVGHGGRTDQDRVGEPDRSRLQIQPAAPHRRRARLRREVRRAERHSEPRRMITLVLLRHGESTWNKENRFTGWYDVDLSERGRAEAEEAGRLLREGGFTFDIAYTSVLKRAIRTLWIALDELDLLWIPVIKSWRLNERHYGALQGLNKAETAAKHGDAQVKIWRRSYDIPPPPLTADDPRYAAGDPRYAGLTPGELPLTESLKDTVARFLPYWHEHDRAGHPVGQARPDRRARQQPARAREVPRRRAGRRRSSS